MSHHTCGREVNSPPHVRSSLVPLTIPDTKFSTRLNVRSSGELTSRPYVQRSWCLSRVVSQHDRLLGYQEITPVPHWEGHSHTTLRRRSPPLWRLKEHGQTQHTALQKNIHWGTLVTCPEEYQRSLISSDLFALPGCLILRVCRFELT
jgi:hypothetical protein